MPAKREVALRFRDKTAFGQFCVALSQEDVPFRLAGSRTVVLVEKDLRRLRGRRLRELASAGEMSPVVRGKKRPSLLSASDTEELLWRMAKRR